MIPIKDHASVSIVPFVTKGLLLLNIAIFFFMFSMSEFELIRFVEQYALIPADIVQGVNLRTLITAMFLHGSLGHIIGNMLFLNIFGDNLEEAMGHLKYLLFYLLCGILASFTQVALSPLSTIPNLGASGAIAGLMGAYLLLFPNHQIDILIPIVVVFHRATVPAFTMLFYWIASQFLLGFGSIGAGEQGGVAYAAHIGGFIAGIVLVYFFASKRKLEVRELED